MNNWDNYIGQKTNYGVVKSIWPQCYEFIIVNVEGGSQFMILGSTLKLITDKQVFYYYVDAKSEHQRFFKAINKKQIKKYLKDKFVSYDTVFDPSSDPVDGVYYIDVTAYPVEEPIKNIETI